MVYFHLRGHYAPHYGVWSIMWKVTLSFCINSIGWERTRYKLYIHQNGFSAQLAFLFSNIYSCSWKIWSSLFSNLSVLLTFAFFRLLYSFVFSCPLSLRLTLSSQAILAILTTQFFFMKSFDKFSSSGKQDTPAWIDENQWLQSVFQ